MGLFIYPVLTTQPVAAFGSLHPPVTSTGLPSLSSHQHVPVPDPATGGTYCAECGLVGDAPIVNETRPSEGPGSGRGLGVSTTAPTALCRSLDGHGSTIRRSARSEYRHLSYVERNTRSLVAPREHRDKKLRAVLPVVAGALEVPPALAASAEEILVRYRNLPGSRTGNRLEVQSLAGIFVAYRTAGLPFDWRAATVSVGVSVHSLWKFVKVLERSKSVSGAAFPILDSRAFLRVMARYADVRAVYPRADALLAALPPRLGGRDPVPRVVAAAAFGLTLESLGKMTGGKAGLSQVAGSWVSIARKFGATVASLRHAKKAILDEIRKDPSKFPGFETLLAPGEPPEG